MIRKLVKTFCLAIAAFPVFADSILIDNLVLQGATVLESDEIEALSSDYVGRPLDVEDIVALVNSVTALYIEKGYINSGASLPEQDLSDGTLEITVKEGRLSEITVTESGRISARHIESVIRGEVSGPLQISSLQRAFNRLENDATIDTVKGQLVPGSMPGESVLNVSVVETDPFTLTVLANNYRSPSVGSEQGQVFLRHINLTGHSDVLSAGYNKTDGIDSGSLSYSFPITRLQTRVNLFYAKGDTLVVEAPFDQLGLESQTDTTGVRFDVAILDSSARSFTVDVGLETKKSKTSLLGLPYDFSPGSVGGLSKSSVASLGIQYQRRSTSHALSARLTYRKGLDAFNATILPGNVPDGEFDLWQLQASYVLLIPREKNSWTWSTRFNYQHTNDVLQAFERFPLGGHGSIRGYRENQILRDKAWEFRTQVDVPLFKNSEVKSTLTVFPFFDAGRGKNAQPVPNVVDSVSLRSIGLGVRWDLGDFRFLLEWANRLSEKRKQANELQDDGIHVGVSYEF